MLLAFNVINGPSGDAKVPLWRHEACELAMQHLCDHSDVSFHPRVRSEAGEVVDVARHVHARAFLEHHKHASAIVSFLVERFFLMLSFLLASLSFLEESSAPKPKSSP